MSAVLSEIETMADLVKELGVDGSRIRMHPPPGLATEKDVIEIHDRTNRLYELIDGVLVEKVMGHFESRVAAVLVFLFETYRRSQNIGYVLAPDGFMRLRPGRVRLPDVAFIRWDRVAGGRVPRTPIPDVVPNLAVEVLSISNTRTEMARKRCDYFEAGVELVWQIDPDEQTFEVFTSPDDSVVIGVAGVVDGGTVLPGFELSVREFFAQADSGPQQPTP